MKTGVFYQSLKLAAVFLVVFSFNAAQAKTVSSIVQRTVQEQKAEDSLFAIIPYQQNYLLPFFYSTHPYKSIYQGNTPDNQPLDNDELKFQVSLKVPIWQSIFNYPVSLYAAYTQKSYWQAYNTSPFFRETNYQPEIFFSQRADKKLFQQLVLNYVNYGAVHQSNGRGGSTERSWNRLYADFVFSRNKLMISIMPWLVIRDNSLHEHNRDITKYLGHGELTVAYNFHDNVFTLKSRNNIESAFKKGSVELTWSFPLIKKIKGFVQAFSGYGQSLIEYNHDSTSIGVGFALNDII